LKKDGGFMDTRIALLGIFVEDRDSTPRLQELLHEYGEYIVGRMGIPNARKGLSVISIVIDAPQDVISALSGKIGMLPGVSVQTMYSKIDK
jgi:putative iron-only hydrogenase system regulator